MYKFNNFQTGFSIVELMVAITLVMIISAAILTVFVNSSRSYNEDERYSRMMENGRYALNTLADDLKQADFWGEMVIPPPPPGGLTQGEDCDTDLLNPDSALLYYHSAAGTPVFNPTGGGCQGVIGTLRANTDAVAIKRVASEPFTPAPTNGRVYLRTNSVTGELIEEAGTPPGSAEIQDWLYIQRLYYIRDHDDGTPYLCRANISTSGSPFSLTASDAANECMAEGIEQLRIEFGLDTDGDGVANQYKLDLIAAEVEEAVTARVYLLARSTRPNLGYVNDKTYSLGSTSLGPFNDGFYRRVFSITIALRNPASHITLR